MADPLSLDDFHGLVRPGGVAVSPDGTRVAVLATESDPDADAFRSALYVAPTDGSADPHRLTRASDARFPGWSPDGSKLAFLAARDDVARCAGRPDVGDDAETGTGLDDPEQVHVFDMARGGDARRVTDFDEGASEYTWSPDGERLAVAARDPTDAQRERLRTERGDDHAPTETTRTRYKADGRGYLDDVTTALFVVDAEDGDATRLDGAYDAGASFPDAGLQPSWSPTGRIAFCTDYAADNEETYVVDVHSVRPDGTDHRVHTDGTLAAGAPRWSPDGERLAFVAGDPENVHVPAEAYVTGVEGAPDAYESVSASLDRTLAGAAAWTGDDELLAPLADEGVTRLVRLDADADDPERTLGAQGDDRTITAFSALGGTAAVVLSDPSAGADVYTAPVEALDDPAPLTRVSALNDDLLSGAVMPAVERVSWANGDGETVRGVAYYPPGEDPAELPAVVSVHGGPTSYDPPRFAFDYAYWVGRGYLVCTVDYRGSTSYGRAFSEVIRGDWGPREADDVLSCADELVSRGWADPDRLFLTGFSQGAINALHVVTRDDRFAAAAPEHGVYDFHALYGNADTYLWYEHDFGLPWEHPERYRAISTIDRVADVDTPLLLTAGGDDWRCPRAQSERLYLAAKRAGVEAKLVVYPDESHDVSRPRRAVHRLDALTSWFENHDPGRDESESAN